MVLDSLVPMTLDNALMINCLAFLGGLIIHVIQKLIQHEISFKEYLNNHGGRTLLSFGSLAMAFYGIQSMMPEATVLTYLLSGYSIDSLINKAPINQRRALDLMIDSSKSKEVS